MNFFKDPRHQILKMELDIRPLTSSFEDVFKTNKEIMIKKCIFQTGNYTVSLITLT